MKPKLGNLIATPLSPCCWTKRLPLWQERLDRRPLKVHCLLDNGVAPPLRRLDVVQGKRKEEDERAKRQPEVEAARGEKVEARPPAEVALLDPALENEADDAPGKVVERRGGRNGAGAAKDDGRHEVLGGRAGPAPGPEVDGNGRDSTQDEEEEEPGVDAAGGEDARWADETPDDGRCVSSVSI